MKVGIAGKGGVGKTTISAVLARSMARRGRRVVAIDCDSDPHLALNLGIAEDAAERIRPLLDQCGPDRSWPEGASPTTLIQEYGHAGPDEVTLILAARAEKAGSG